MRGCCIQYDLFSEPTGQVGTEPMVIVIGIIVTIDLTFSSRTFRPDFVLIREYIQGPDKRYDFKNVLLGLIHGLVPSVNSLTSIYNFLDRPVVVSVFYCLFHPLPYFQFWIFLSCFYHDIFTLSLMRKCLSDSFDEG